MTLDRIWAHYRAIQHGITPSAELPDTISLPRLLRSAPDGCRKLLIFNSGRVDDLQRLMAVSAAADRARGARVLPPDAVITADVDLSGQVAPKAGLRQLVIVNLAKRPFRFAKALIAERSVPAAVIVTLADWLRDEGIGSVDMFSSNSRLVEMIRIAAILSGIRVTEFLHGICSELFLRHYRQVERMAQRSGGEIRYVNLLAGLPVAPEIARNFLIVAGEPAFFRNERPWVPVDDSRRYDVLIVGGNTASGDFLQSPHFGNEIGAIRECAGAGLSVIYCPHPAVGGRVHAALPEGTPTGTVADYGNSARVLVGHYSAVLYTGRLLGHAVLIFDDAWPAIPANVSALFDDRAAATYSVGRVVALCRAPATASDGRMRGLPGGFDLEAAAVGFDAARPDGRTVDLGRPGTRALKQIWAQYLDIQNGRVPDTGAIDRIALPRLQNRTDGRARGSKLIVGDTGRVNDMSLLKRVAAAHDLLQGYAPVEEAAITVTDVDLGGKATAASGLRLLTINNLRRRTPGLLNAGLSERSLASATILTLKKWLEDEEIGSLDLFSSNSRLIEALRIAALLSGIRVTEFLHGICSDVFGEYYNLLERLARHGDAPISYVNVLPGMPQPPAVTRSLLEIGGDPVFFRNERDWAPRQAERQHDVLIAGGNVAGGDFLISASFANERAAMVECTSAGLGVVYCPHPLQRERVRPHIPDGITVGNVADFANSATLLVGNFSTVLFNAHLLGHPVLIFADAWAAIPENLIALFDDRAAATYTLDRVMKISRHSSPSVGNGYRVPRSGIDLAALAV